MKFKIYTKILYCIFYAFSLRAEIENFDKQIYQGNNKGHFLMGPNGFYDKLSFPENMKSIRYWEMVMK